MSICLMCQLAKCYLAMLSVSKGMFPGGTQLLVAIHDIKQAYTVRYQIGIFLANGTASYTTWYKHAPIGVSSKKLYFITKIMST